MRYNIINLLLCYHNPLHIFILHSLKKLHKTSFTVNLLLIKHVNVILQFLMERKAQSGRILINARRGGSEMRKKRG